MSEEWGPWIGWNGGERPVDGGKKVQFVWHGACGIVISEDFAQHCGWSASERDGSKYFMSSYRVKKEPVVDVRREVVTIGHGVAQFIAYATCTYTDGKLTKIHWEADDAD